MTSILGFTTIQIYTTLKLILLLHTINFCFTTIQIYTTLKPNGAVSLTVKGFTTIQIYTTLKHIFDGKFFIPVLLPYKFTLLSNNILPLYNLRIVLLPYKFTLLSNLKPQIITR